MIEYPMHPGMAPHRSSHVLPSESTRSFSSVLPFSGAVMVAFWAGAAQEQLKASEQRAQVRVQRARPYQRAAAKLAGDTVEDGAFADVGAAHQSEHREHGVSFAFRRRRLSVYRRWCR